MQRASHADAKYNASSPMGGHACVPSRITSLTVWYYACRKVLV